MAKDPRFNFYPDNYDGGTDGFTLEQHGAYMQLMIMQFRKGRFTQEQAIDKLMQCTRGNTAVSTGLWSFLLPKFETDGKLFWSARLEKEIEKSKIHSEKQSERIKKRWDKEKTQSGTDSGNTAVLPVRTGIRNSNDTIVFGIKGELHISVKKKYANEQAKIIYDLREYFAQQAEQFQRQGWTKFDDFMKDNPGRVFDDDDHVYNSFKKFHLTPNGNVQRKLNPGKLQ